MRIPPNEAIQETAFNHFDGFRLKGRASGSDFVFSARDVGGEGFVDGGVEVGLLVFLQELFPDRVGALGGGLCAGFLPALVVAPV